MRLVHSIGEIITQLLNDLMDLFVFFRGRELSDHALKSDEVLVLFSLRKSEILALVLQLYVYRKAYHSVLAGR